LRASFGGDVALKLYFHPLASFCHKVLIALYENGTAFEPVFVDLGNPREREALAKLWAPATFPVLRDEARDRTIAESSIIIEYLAQHYPGRVALLPADPEAALRVRMQDRFFDLYVHHQMQKIVLDRIRPADQRDAFGVEQARGELRLAYDMLEQDMRGNTWAVGEQFTMADCAASPALFYANEVLPFGASHPGVAAYFARLKARPSCARVLEEAQPYLKNFPR
jgi:glutathione S-transferase